jgi:hypothetical protein
MAACLWVLPVMILSFSPALAGYFVDLEIGAVFSGYNDVRIPGDGGTLISLSRELSSDAVPYGRARIGRTFGGRHSLSLLVAPLRIEASGTADKEVAYMGKIFPQGTDLISSYRFDSYRLTYRWGGLRRRKIEAGIGLTAKIRDASISLSGAGSSAEKKNTGFVPIVNFRVAWSPADRLTALLEGDALAAPQGRAEDVFAGAVWRLGRRVSLKAGYRVLEGGADNEEVYTFSLFHYAALGVVVEL